MRAKYVVALSLAIIGTNVITYAITRRVTTERVLTRAQDKMTAIIKNDGYYNAAYPSELPGHVTWALLSVGGRYYWHNEALEYFGLGGLLVVVGYVVASGAKKTKDG